MTEEKEGAADRLKGSYKADAAHMQISWSEILEQLLAGGDLTEQHARDAMSTILGGEAEPAQMAGLLVAMRAKGPSAKELAGFLAAMQDAAEHVPVDAEQLGLIDTCGTGGDGHNTINISTAAAIVVAGAGGKVCKHGNRAVSSASGSADVLEALGIDIEMGPNEVAYSIAVAGIGFCFAPRFHPAMRHVGPVRKDLGIPTFFNFLGPLANPARVRRQIIGVSDPEVAETIAAVLERLDHRHAMVVVGHDGLDELSANGAANVIHLKEGKTTRYEIDPRKFGISKSSADAIRGGDAAANAESALAVLNGEHGPKRDVVALNAAAGLIVTDLAADMEEGMEMAASAIDSGKAMAVLSAWREFSERTTDRRKTDNHSKTHSKTHRKEVQANA